MNCSLWLSVCEVNECEMTTEEVKLPVNVSIIKSFSLYCKPGWISFFNGISHSIHLSSIIM